jgi:tetratricopeptide (TPR) repeat protein
MEEHTIKSAAICFAALLIACMAREAAIDRETCFAETGDVAIAACTRLIESGEFMGNGLAPIYFNRGVTWYDMGDHDRAIQDYNEAIKLNPNFEQAFFNRGNAFDENEQFERAIQDYDRAIALKPDYAKVFNNRGYAYDEEGAFDRAIQDYDRAIALKPDYAKAFNNRAISYAKKSQYAYSGSSLIAWS